MHVHAQAEKRQEHREEEERREREQLQRCCPTAEGAQGLHAPGVHLGGHAAGTAPQQVRRAGAACTCTHKHACKCRSTHVHVHAHMLTQPHAKLRAWMHSAARKQ